MAFQNISGKSICTTHDVELEWLPGRSAHRSNRYCPECDRAIAEARSEDHRLAAIRLAEVLTDLNNDYGEVAEIKAAYESARGIIEEYSDLI